MLDPDDFALTDGTPEPPPSDLVSKKTWHSIMHLPEDVLIRTTNRYGKAISLAHKLASDWESCISEEVQADRLDAPLLDVTFDHDAFLLNALHGYYKQAFAILRDILEATAIGAYCQLKNDDTLYQDWRNGEVEIGFGVACDYFHMSAATKPFADYLMTNTGKKLFAQKDRKIGYAGGIARELYASLSHFSHPQPQKSNADIWQSNGPIFVAEAFEGCIMTYLEVLALCYILIKLARPNFHLPKYSKFFLCPTDASEGLKMTLYSISQDWQASIELSRYAYYIYSLSDN